MAYHKYCEAEEFISDKIQNANEDSTEQTASIVRLLEEVSAFVDTFCQRPAGYFLAVANDAEATMKRFRGQGYRFLRLPRHIAGTVTIAGISSEAYYENGVNGWVYSNSAIVAGENNLPEDAGCLFQRDRLYEVSAKWGFEQMPADIKKATKEIAQMIWDRGNGVMGQITPTGFVIERDMPPSAATTLAPWVKREFEIE